MKVIKYLILKPTLILLCFLASDIFASQVVEIGKPIGFNTITAFSNKIQSIPAAAVRQILSNFYLSENGRNPDSVGQSCDCCEYQHSAVYGAKYKSNGHLDKANSKSWCALNDSDSKVSKQQRRIASLSLQPSGFNFEQAKANLALKSLNKVFAAKHSKKDVDLIASNVYRNESRRNPQFKRHLKGLIKNSIGLMHRGSLNSKKIENVIINYKGLLRSSSDNFLDNPPESIIAYQSFFKALRDQVSYINK